MKPQAAGGKGPGAPPPAENKVSIYGCGLLATSLQSWRGGRREGRAAGRPGRAPGTIPSCIICKYCEVKSYPHPPSLRPPGVWALPDPHWAKVSPFPPPRPSPPPQTYCKLADLSSRHGRPHTPSQASWVQGLGPTLPKNPVCVGGAGKGPGKRRAA